MKNQKKEKRKVGVLGIIFIILGVIFALLILVIGIIIFIKPYGVDVIKVAPALFNESTTSTFDHPYLTTQQEVILESAGVNLKTVPTEITPAQQDCSVSILGQTRVDEIIAGSTPSMSEILKVKSCF